MNDAEWAEFAGRVEATFRGGLPDDREHELRRHVGRVPFDVACRALERLVVGEASGHGIPTPPQVFVPTPAELVAAVRRVTGGGWAFRVAMSGLTSDELQRQLADAWAAERGIPVSPLRALPGGEEAVA